MMPAVHREGAKEKTPGDGSSKQRLRVNSSLMSADNPSTSDAVTAAYPPRFWWLKRVGGTLLLGFILLALLWTWRLHQANAALQSLSLIMATVIQWSHGLSRSCSWGCGRSG